ncbi:MAG: hypothetical protein HYY24_02535 [Verrucomicrobia bacterium]|nr:hypothetical protein [Verrucomicrobiota bacterium]
MNHQTRVYDSLFEMLPSEENPSPMVRVNPMNPCPAFHLFAKLEWLNPFGSVKNRAAEPQPKSWVEGREDSRHLAFGHSRPARLRGERIGERWPGKICAA